MIETRKLLLQQLDFRIRIFSSFLAEYSMFVSRCSRFLVERHPMFKRFPYNQMLRDEVGLRSGQRYTVLNVLFAALIEILCVIRLFSSLGPRLGDPVRGDPHAPPFRQYLA